MGQPAACKQAGRSAALWEGAASPLTVSINILLLVSIWHGAGEGARRVRGSPPIWAVPRNPHPPPPSPWGGGEMGHPPGGINYGETPPCLHSVREDGQSVHGLTFEPTICQAPPGCLWSEKQTLARRGLEGTGHRFQTGRRGGDRPGRKSLKMRHSSGGQAP